MSEIAMNAAHMIDMLPDPDKNLAYELIKKLVLAWDPDFTCHSLPTDGRSSL